MLDALNGYELTRTTDKRADALAVLANGAAKECELPRGAQCLQGEPCARRAPRKCKTAYLQLKADAGLPHHRTYCRCRQRHAARLRHLLGIPGQDDVDYAPFVTLNGACAQGARSQGQADLRRGSRLMARPTRSPSAPACPRRSMKCWKRLSALDIYVKDRSQMVRFTGDSFVLPSTARRGIPLVSVNMTSRPI